MFNVKKMSRCVGILAIQLFYWLPTSLPKTFFKVNINTVTLKLTFL
jgi:hypothetical protein